MKFYTIIDNEVYVKEIDDNDETSHLTYIIGTLVKTETVRLDSQNVVDINYSFDLELGEYVEQSREQRVEPLPDPPLTPEQIKIEQLELENAILRERDAQIQEDINAIFDALLG